MLIYYIRHGDPTYNPDGLTSLGRRQAEAVGKRLAERGFDRIFASSAGRAIETATPFSEIAKKEIEVLDFANEGHAWQEFAVDRESDGLHTWVSFCPEFQKLFVSKEMQLLGDKWYEHPAIRETKMPAGVKRVNAAVDEWILSLGYEHDRESHTYRKVAKPPERVAFFAHQGFSWCFMSSLLDIPYPTYSTHFNIEHTGVTVISFGEEDDKPIIPMVLQLSSDAHLWEHGLPTRYSNGIFI